jgi:hypothetical protein
MKIKILLFVSVLLVLSTVAFAQSVVITPKKTVYTRKLSGIDREKRTFEVRYPIVSGALGTCLPKNL